MKSKSPLVLMEQLIMLLVFALAAALCLQLFVFSGKLSRTMQARDNAVTMVQNAAESVKICDGISADYAELLGGTEQDGIVFVFYDADWQQTERAEAEYCITVQKQETDRNLLGTATVSASTADGTELFTVTTAWQEDAHE